MGDIKNYSTLVSYFCFIFFIKTDLFLLVLTLTVKKKLIISNYRFSGGLLNDFQK
jgi:hypothetical protein